VSVYLDHVKVELPLVPDLSDRHPRQVFNARKGVLTFLVDVCFFFRPDGRLLSPFSFMESAVTEYISRV